MNAITSLLALLVLIVVSGCSSSTEPEGLPQQPVSPQVAALGSTVTLTWSAAGDSASVTGYRIIVVGPSGDSTVLDLPGTARSAQINGLQTGQAYAIYLHAKMGDKLSPGVKVQYTAAQMPKSPLNLQATNGPGTTSATITWSAPADTGITGYRIRWRAAIKPDSGLMDVGAGQTSVQINNLIENEDYTISISTQRGTTLSSPVTILLARDNRPVPTAVSKVTVTPLNPTTIAVQWTASSDATVTGYRVIYRSEATSTIDSLTTNTTTATITGLDIGAIYTITIKAIRGAKESPPATAQSATAARYDTEPGSATPLRIYEQGSINGAGLTLDPAKGGPKNVLVGSSNPDLSTVQLSMYVDNTTQTFDIGPAYAFGEYKNVDKFDSTVYTNDSTFLAPSLDSWFYNSSIEDRIQTDGNVRAFTMPFAVGDVINGQAFFIRTGKRFNYHYARVLVKNNNGRFLQGTGSNRYVELSISYQTTVNLPYAKVADGWNSPSGVASHRRR